MKTHRPDAPIKEDASQSHAQRRSPSPEQLAALAEKIHGMRSRKMAFPGSDLIAEPGWEMLIALFRADAASYRLTVSNACRASHAPATTALRWLDRLTELGLVCRKDDPLDARVVFIELKPKARLALRDYFSEIWVTLYGAD